MVKYAKNPEGDVPISPRGHSPPPWALVYSALRNSIGLRFILRQRALSALADKRLLADYLATDSLRGWIYMYMYYSRVLYAIDLLSLQLPTLRKRHSAGQDNRHNHEF